MKVLVLGDAGSVHIAKWVNGLCQEGLSIVLVSQHPVTQPYLDPVRHYPLKYKGQLGYLLNANQLKSIIDQERPHVVNAHYASGYGTTARLARAKPVLLSVWGSDVYDFPNKSPLHRYLLLANLRSACLIASTGRKMANQVRSLLKVDENIHITPFGVDVETFTPRPRAGREELIVGTVKALAPHYGIDLLLKAFAAARQRLSSSAPSVAAKMQLRIVGGGSEADLTTLTTLADELGIAGVTQFCGRADHAKVPEELSNFDVYVALSRRESFGVAALEAQACGVPVVVSDADGFLEIVQDGHAGFIVPLDAAVERASQAIMQLLLDPAKRAWLGHNGRIDVLSKYSWKNSLAIMLSALEETRRRYESTPPPY